MLPGGLDIIGVFAMATQDAMKNAQLQLRKVMSYAMKKRNLSTNLKMLNSSLNRDIVFIFSSLLPTIVHKLVRISFFLACRTFKEYE